MNAELPFNRYSNIDGDTGSRQSQEQAVDCLFLLFPSCCHDTLTTPMAIVSAKIYWSGHSTRFVIGCQGEFYLKRVATNHPNVYPWRRSVTRYLIVQLIMKMSCSSLNYVGNIIYDTNHCKITHTVCQVMLFLEIVNAAVMMLILSMIRCQVL